MMHAPAQIHPHSLADYLEIMSKAVFQTGISWKVVDSKWPETREAFGGFDPIKIARYTDYDIDALVTDTRVIRNRRKLEAITENAQRILDLDKEYGGFQKYLRSFRSYEELASDLKKQFRFMGELGIYYFLWVVGERVPPWEEWYAGRPVARPRKLVLKDIHTISVG
jgi:DNA-3-methyladenine glycosylase I